MSKLVLNTGNAGKVAEFAQLLDFLQATELLTITAAEQAIAVPELQLDDTERRRLAAGAYGEVAAAISKAKALSALEISGVPLLVEDTQYFASGLKGLPGPCIKDWAQDRELRQALCRAIFSTGDLSVITIVSLAVAWAPGEADCRQGQVGGLAPPEPRGNNGFGWDDIFVPLGPDCNGRYRPPGQTFAEMDPLSKYNCSPRTLALKSLIERPFQFATAG